VLETGRVLHYGYTALGGTAAAYVFDPDQPLSGTLVPPPANHFCGGGAFLYDGSFLAVGGSTSTATGGTYGIAATSRFDPALEMWISTPELQTPRWYPTTTVLPDGRLVAASGLNQYGVHVVQLERFTPGVGWSVLVGADQSLQNYPFFHLAPNGKIFHAGPEPYLHWFDVETGAWTFVGFHLDGPRYEGSSVLLPPLNDRVLVLGGGEESQTAKESAEVWVLQGNGAAGHLAPPMSSPRANASAVLLPTQDVLVLGGALEVGTKGCSAPGTPVLATELFDPETESWIPLAPMTVPREYHSQAVLLPDARILVSGTDCEWTAEIFSPPYLFQGPRPVVTGVPAEVERGAAFSFDVLASEPVESVVLMAPAAATHAFDQHQRCVPVSFQSPAPGNLLATLPSNPALLPPGPYMLFVVDGAGVPSVASFVRVKATPVVTSVSPATTPLLGGGPLTVQGSNFSGASAVRVGGYAVTPPGFAVLSPSEIVVWIPPIVDTLGPQPVAVTTHLGTSAPGSVEYVANDPPYLQAPAAVSSPGSFDAVWAGLPGALYFLLFWVEPTTAPLLGADLLYPHIRLQSGLLSPANGFGLTSIPIPAGVPPATFYTQVATFDPAGPALRVSLIRTTVIE
jgi:hypothetical protein